MILIIDFGSQTAHLIGRRLRKYGIDVIISDPEDALPSIKKIKPKGIILSGGPASVYEYESPTINPKIFTLNIPILGICYGHQITAYLLNGIVKPGKFKEYGPAIIKINKSSILLSDIKNKRFQVWMSHGDEVIKPPKGFSFIAKTNNTKAAIMQNEAQKIYCVQFHPEVNHTKNGLLMLRNFAEKICGETICETNFNLKEIISDIKAKIGDKKIICAVSGGVDSTVSAFLIARAVGKQLIPVYIDSGLMRPETKERVNMIFSKLLKINPVIINAKHKFIKNLKGAVDPEIKRKIVGKLYIDLFETESAKHRGVAFLGQGTIYSDVIESKGSKHASHIKSHHNVGGLPLTMKLKLIEPLRTFYKDEVRELGLKLGLPKEIINEHPFPGPGYAVRIRGEITRKRLEQERLADNIVLDEIKTAGLYDKLFQCFAVMTGAYSTAVKGDSRVFAEVVGIRAYESDDIMTSKWADLPYSLLQKISSRIVNEVPDISRVVYDITTKPPATMEWE